MRFISMSCTICLCISRRITTMILSLVQMTLWLTRNLLITVIGPRRSLGSRQRIIRLAICMSRVDLNSLWVHLLILINAGYYITQSSRTDFLVYMNSDPIYWIPTNQTSVETSSLRYEFCAMRLCTEYLHGLRYRMIIMGIPCGGLAYVYGENQSVLLNTTIPE